MRAPRSFTVFVGLYLLFLYAPVMLLPIFAFNDSAVIAFPLKGFTFGWFEGLANETTLFVALKNSLIVALSSAVLSTCVGVLAARAAARYEFFGKKPIMSFLMLPLVLPEIIVGVSLLIVLVQLGLDLNVWTVILGHVLFNALLILAVPFSGLLGTVTARVMPEDAASHNDMPAHHRSVLDLDALDDPTLA
ncbi:MAG: hypothetical protein VW554_03735, partial [Alphaproteobacteria bacterium]